MTKFQKMICLLLAIGLVLGCAMAGAGVLILNQTRERLREKQRNTAFCTAFAQQTDMLSHFEHEVREIDAENFQVVLAVTARPRMFAENITAKLACAGEPVPMVFGNGAFTGEIAIPLDIQYVYEPGYVIILECGGVVRSQFAALELSELDDGKGVFTYPERWGEIKGGISLPTTRDIGTNPQYQLDTVLRLNESFLPFGDQAVSVRIYAEDYDGEELFSVEMNGNIVELEQEFSPLGARIFGEVRGKSGMTYLYVLREFGYDYSNFDAEDTEFVENDIHPYYNLWMIGAQEQELSVRLAGYSHLGYDW